MEAPGKGTGVSQLGRPFEILRLEERVRPLLQDLLAAGKSAHSSLKTPLLIHISTPRFKRGVRPLLQDILAAGRGEEEGFHHVRPTQRDGIKVDQTRLHHLFSAAIDSRFRM